MHSIPTRYSGAEAVGLAFVSETVATATNSPYLEAQLGWARRWGFSAPFQPCLRVQPRCCRPGSTVEPGVTGKVTAMIFEINNRRVLGALDSRGRPTLSVALRQIRDGEGGAR